MFTRILPSVCLCNASRRDINYFCVVHESGRGLFAHAKGRPTGSKITPLPCSTSMMDNINELRKDFGLNNETKMVVMLSISMNDMNSMLPFIPRFGLLIALQVCDSKFYVKISIIQIRIEVSI
jgi:hypothetical protein